MMLHTRMFQTARVHPDGDGKSLGIVAVLSDGSKQVINSILQLRWFRRLAVKWETLNGESLDSSVVSNTLKDFSNGVYQ
jgi:hypothetical protein